MSRLSKHVLAAYYSDARLNILLCLNDIREKMGKKPLANDDQIVSAFKGLDLIDAEPEIQSELIFQLRKRFRFLDAVTDLPPKEIAKKDRQDEVTHNPSDYAHALEWMFKLINSLRNAMIHPSDGELMLSHQQYKDLFYALGKIYDASLSTLKQRFDYDTAVIKPLLRYGELKQRGQKPQPKPFDNFSLALCPTPKDENANKQHQQSQVLYDYGHVLFCSLFLDKSQSAAMIAHFWQTPAAKDWYDEERVIIKNLLTVYSAYLPRQRLKSDNSLTATTVDSISELARCPRALLKTLSKEDQERFRSVPNEEDGEIAENEASYLFARGHQNRFVPFIMRYFDFDPNCQIRFALDLGQFYYNVRLKPASRFTDGKPRVRRLGQKILHYARLSDIQQSIKPDDWQQLETNYLNSSEEEKAQREHLRDDIVQLKPYIVQSYPHYHYFHDKIGIRLATDAGEVANYPNLQADQAANNVCLQAPRAEDMQPEFWLSPSQLMHIAFYRQRHKALPEKMFLSVEDILKRYRSGMLKLIKTLLNENTPEFAGQAFSPERQEAAQYWINSFFDLQYRGKTAFSVTLADLPKVLINHLIGEGKRQIPAQTVKDRLQFLIDETQAKQEHIDRLLKQAKKRGKKGFKAIKCGQLGDFIADDLMRFQPIDRSKPDGGKINSQQYQILQAALAYYGVHIYEPPKIVDLLKNAGLLEGEFAHPFLSHLNLQAQPDKYRGLISFYIDYLNVRKSYLEQLQKGDNKIYTQLPKWLGIRQHSSLDNWLTNFTDENGQLQQQKGILKQPLPLPKNAFFEPLFNMSAATLNISEAELMQDGGQTYQRHGKTVNVRPAISWLIRRVLAAQDDRAQAMYNYSRNHVLFDDYLDKRSHNQRFNEKQKHHLPESQRVKNLSEIKQKLAKENNKDEAEKIRRQLTSYKRQEKRLRHSITQDILLYFYAKENLNKLQLSDNTPTPKWTLQGMQKTLLNTPIYYELPISDTGKQIFHPECKIRNLGEMRLLAQHRSLSSLLSYYPEKETQLHQEEVRAELNSYRRVRIDVMALVHELEANIIKKYGELLDKPEDLKAHFGGRHGQFLYTLYTDNQADFNLDLFVKARLIRNAFAHSEYPDVCSFTTIAHAVAGDKIPENPTKHRKIAERLLIELQQLYAPWNSQIIEV